MSAVRSFFLEEAGECLDELRSCTGPGSLHPPRAYAAARRLRGSAQVARYGPVAEEAGRLEARLKPMARGAAGGPGQGAGASLTVELAGLVRAVGRAVEGVREGRINQNPRAERDMDEGQSAAMAELPIDELEYRGEAALARALELRAALERAIVEDQQPGPILDELFDLIRMGMG